MVRLIRLFRKLNRAADEIIKIEQSVTRMEGMIVDRIEA